MGDVLKRRTRRGWRFYARGYIKIDEAGNLRRTSKLILVDHDGIPVDSMLQATEEIEWLNR